MDEKKEKIEPPYTPYGQVKKILDLLGSMNPKTIDSKFISSYNIATPSNAFRVIGFLKWIKLIDSEGNVNRDRLSKLKLVGKDKDSAIKEFIEESYEDVFSSINIKDISDKNTLVNFFINEYKFGREKAIHATNLIIYLCKEYAISINEELSESVGSLRERKPKSNKIAKKKRSEIKKDIDISQEDSDMEGILIIIKGNNINIKLSAKNKEELKKIIEEKIPSIRQTLEIFLPGKSKEDEDEKTQS